MPDPLRRLPKLVNPNTSASRPGGIPVDYRVWIRCFPQRTVGPLLGIFALLLLLVAGLVWRVWSLEIVSLYLLYRIGNPLQRRVRLIREHFESGCLLPGKVVSVEPYLVAVFTDLRTGRQSCPAVKIVPQPLGRIRGPRLKVGDRVPCVALYQGPAVEGKRWRDFNPIAVSCVTNDYSYVAYALSRLDASTAETWSDLDAYLATLPDQTKPGLYVLPPIAAESQAAAS